MWLSEDRDAGSKVSWMTGEGRVRNVGTAPPGAELAEPSIEDAYLLLVGASGDTAEAIA